jgi:hypothetical protein
MTCTHSSRTDFGMKHSEHPHEYCPECGWHRYCGKEYTREEWAREFIEETEEENQGELF